MAIDDPDGTLERYLRAPHEVTPQLREHALRRLLEIGTEAAKADDVPRAQAALSRA